MKVEIKRGEDLKPMFVIDGVRTPFRQAIEKCLSDTYKPVVTYTGDEEDNFMIVFAGQELYFDFPKVEQLALADIAYRYKEVYEKLNNVVNSLKNEEPIILTLGE